MSNRIEKLLKIKIIFGRGYASKITELLKKNNFLNAKGEPYSESSIRMYLNGNIPMSDELYVKLLNVTVEHKNSIVC